MTNFNWDATTFFLELTEKNILAQDEKFLFCRVSGLQGLEEMLQSMQSHHAFVAVSDIAQGYMQMNNTPHTRRVKTVFFAMRHKVDDMAARQSRMDTMRELFRQFMTKLILEKTRLEQNSIYLDPRISFNEIDQYFFSGCACCYFQVAVDVFTDLRLNDDEWVCEGPTHDLWMVQLTSQAKVAAIKLIRGYTHLGLKEAKDFVDNLPKVLIANVYPGEHQDVFDYFDGYFKLEYRPIQR